MKRAPGFDLVSSFPIVTNTSVSEDAANTVRLPVSALSTPVEDVAQAPTTTVAARQRAKTARTLGRTASALRDLDDHVGRLDHADDIQSGPERELGRGLSRHEADESVRSRLDLDNGRDAVLGDARHHSRDT